MVQVRPCIWAQAIPYRPIVNLACRHEIFVFAMSEARELVESMLTWSVDQGYYSLSSFITRRPAERNRLP
jgi:hypothetical protein